MKLRFELLTNILELSNSYWFKLINWYTNIYSESQIMQPIKGCLFKTKQTQINSWF